MKILHLLQSNRFSGAENVACQIIDMFSGDADMKLAYCSPDGPVRNTIEDRGIEFYPLSKLDLKQVRRVVSQFKPDVIHAHDARASVIAALCCGKTPLVVHMHGNSAHSQKLTLKAILFGLAARKARHIFWVSHSAFEGYYFGKLFRHKGSVLHNILDGEDVRRRANDAECQEQYDAVYIGRLEYPKNPERVASILCDVANADCSVKAAIVGFGSGYEDVKAYVEGRDLSERVRLLGYIDNPLGIMRNAKVMIMASRWEGMPISALESGCLGVPMVCTPTDGLRELIVDGVTGYLSDDDQRLVSKCLEVIRNEHLRARLSEAARARTEEMMDVKAYRNKVFSVYFECVESKQ